jgi:hypothetical protein
MPFDHAYKNKIKDLQKNYLNSWSQINDFKSVGVCKYYSRVVENQI